MATSPDLATTIALLKKTEDKIIQLSEYKLAKTLEALPQATQGPKGDPGIPGETIIGPAGKDGRDGKSIVGPPGPKGDPGETIVGPTGESIVGPPGPPGEAITGPPGESITGPTGKDGRIGKPGKDGKSITGPRGPRGERGLQGKSITGPPGPAGKDAKPGKDGKSITGPRGPKGDPGVGIQGKPAKDGKQGKPGKSVKGPKGDKGDKGDPGKDAELETPVAELSERFNKLENNWQIQISQAISRMISASSGGGGGSAGGGSVNILQNDDVVFARPENVVNNSVLVFDQSTSKFVAVSLDTLVNQIVGADVKYTKNIDKVGDISYIGEALPGTANSSSGWRIQQIDETNDPDLTITWASGTADFNKIWDSRAGYSYS